MKSSASKPSHHIPFHSPLARTLQTRPPLHKRIARTLRRSGIALACGIAVMATVGAGVSAHHAAQREAQVAAAKAEGKKRAQQLASTQQRLLMARVY